MPRILKLLFIRRWEGRGYLLKLLILIYNSCIQRQINKFVASNIKRQNEKVELAKSLDPDEVAHNEPPLLDLCCLPSSL